MENQEVEMSNSQHSLKWGAILGLISIIIYLVVYLIDITLLAKSGVGIALLVISLAIVIYAGRDYRSKLGGYMSFKDAFLHAFIVFVLAGFIGTVFNYLLFNFIDPEIVPVLIEAQMTNTMKAMEAFGGGSTDMMDEMAVKMKESYTLTGQATSFLWALIFYAIGALIVGAINKKKDKEEEF
ncbi:DUF4199 domain-containing protein [Marivirga salinae]|uniref:DUF4199 domain-containing protein n=1 Tax=Marivirga salinarum TaxID=3059078 RepID=A0AA51NCI3_9BACT|nr:DUF4199 domain-containing protein [Marivirga sp. BDSF4-3]WMN12628.1 DUF4199 domain-containing protein [Marivirga sp. BDSF4-3]